MRFYQWLRRKFQKPIEIRWADRNGILLSVAIAKESLKILNKNYKLFSIVKNGYEVVPTCSDKLVIRLPLSYLKDPCFMHEGVWS